jgi:DNA-binding transcriptional MerR regulator
MEDSGTKHYQIGQLANLLEMSPRTIRYYEEIGLLNSIKRIEGGKRIYTDKDFQRLRFITRLKHLGLTLSEMLELEDIYQIHQTNRKVLSRVLELLDAHAAKIDERVNSLNKLRADIISYQDKVRQKLSRDEDQKGADTHDRGRNHQRRSDGHR